MLKEHGFNNHHRIPRHLNGSNHPDNLLYIQKFKHDALHALTNRNGKATMPVEQLEIVLDMMGKAIIPEFKHDIKTIIELYGNDIYNNNCYK